jgi:hypothetical protein
MFGPPTLTAALISRASFCQILACNCCFLLIPEATKCFLGISNNIVYYYNIRKPMGIKPAINIGTVSRTTSIPSPF